MQRKLLGIMNVDLNATGQQLVIYCAFVKYLSGGWDYNEAVHQLFVDSRKLMIHLQERSYILIKFSIHM